MNRLYLAAGAQITLTATVEDGDGDTDTAVANITGSFAFRDDGPTVLGVVPDNASVNLIVNGSFEDPSTVPNGWLITNAITGWEDGADGIPFEIQQGGAGGLGAQHGVNLVELDSDTFGNTNVDQNPVDGTNATIFQTISTEAGQSYTLSFWYAPRPGAAASSGLEVRFGGDLVFELEPNANNPAVWQQLTVTVTADGPSSVLAFTSTGAQDELGIFIDNISLTASPILDDEDTTP